MFNVTSLSVMTFRVSGEGFADRGEREGDC